MKITTLTVSSEVRPGILMGGLGVLAVIIRRGYLAPGSWDAGMENLSINKVGESITASYSCKNCE